MTKCFKNSFFLVSLLLLTVRSLLVGTQMSDRPRGQIDLQLFTSKLTQISTKDLRLCPVQEDEYSIPYTHLLGDVHAFP